MDNETKEILTILQEECAEAIVDISKCFRFGPDQMMPGTDTTNIQLLQNELGDIQAMIELLLEKNIGVTEEGINIAKKNKFEKLKTWSNINITK
jgi:hypothetical protein